MNIDNIITKNREDLILKKTSKEFQNLPFNIQTMINRYLKISEFFEKELIRKNNFCSVVDERKINVYTKIGCRVIKIRIGFTDNDFEYKIFKNKKFVFSTKHKYLAANKIATLVFEIKNEENRKFDLMYMNSLGGVNYEKIKSNKKW